MRKKRRSRARERRLDVYVIRNLETGRLYFGVSGNAKRRKKIPGEVSVVSIDALVYSLCFYHHTRTAS